MTRWVFGYGSLIWNPGFDYLRSDKALLRGAHRSLSVYSFRHRGTPERPGLVFGLSRGGSCLGVAFEVADANWAKTFAYLQAREQDRGVYRPVERNIVLAGGESLKALAYLVDEHHPQFAGGLSLAEQIDIVRRGVGESGRNIDYVLSTARHLQTLGIRDVTLAQIVSALEQHEKLSAENA